MAELWDIATITRRTGLTSRALRHYEARELLQPMRAASGRRLYGAAELERIHQIITLKRAGLTLEAIGTVLDRGQHDLAQLIDAQIATVEAEADRLADMRALLLAVKARLGRNQMLDPATLCRLIHDSQQASAKEREAWQQLTDRYMDERVQKEFSRAMPAIGSDFTSAEYGEKWHDLGERISAALPLAPDCAEALNFVREWMALLAPFSAVATPGMWNSTRAMYDDVDSWRGQGRIDPGFDGAVWRFIREATEKALAAGADIGPVPTWFGEQPKKGS